MKLKYEFASVNLGDENVCVPVGDSALTMKGILRLNDEALEIFKFLESDTTMQQIIDALAIKYENDRSELEIFVKSSIDKFREIGLIED